MPRKTWPAIRGRHFTGHATLIAAAVAAMASSPARAGSNGPPQSTGYLINISSFNQFFGVDVTRTIEDAARQWAAYGSSRGVLDNQGTTSEAGCSINNNIFADSTCDGALATTLQCIGTWTIAVHAGCPTVSITATNSGSGAADLQSLVLHEFGHALGLSHTPDVPCVMNASTSVVGRGLRQFCQNDINQVQQVQGSGSSSAWIMNFSNGTGQWPNVDASHWGDFPISEVSGGALLYGWMVGDTMRTEGADLFGWVDYSSNDFRWCEYSPTRNCSPSGLVGITAGPTDQRPIVAYDPTRGYYWLFWDNNSNDGGSIMYTHETSSGWTTPVAITVQSFGSPLSHLPVGASYDYYSDSMVVVFANWASGGVDFGGWTCTSSFGCSGQLNVINLAASSTSTTDQWYPTYLSSNDPGGPLADGAPAIACENSISLYECQVLYNGEGLNRHVMSVNFCLDTQRNGYRCSNPWTTPSDTNGWTDYPIGLTFNGPTEAGNFVGAVTQANTNGFISIIQKRFAANAWGGWQSVGDSPRTHYGPTIKVREATKDYDLIFAN